MSKCRPEPKQGSIREITIRCIEEDGEIRERELRPLEVSEEEALRV